MGAVTVSKSKQTRSPGRAWWKVVCLLCFILKGYESQDLDTSSSGGQLTTCNFTKGVSCKCNSTHVYCNYFPLLTVVPKSIIPKTVTELDLNNHQILKIQENDFTLLENLQTLCLGNNSISSIHVHAFRNLFKLTTLNLEGNNLTSLDSTGLLFQHLVSLSFLNLRNNHIVSISKYSFLTTSGDLTVNLTNNPTTCDCETLALRRWIQTLKAMDRAVYISLQCANDNQNSFLTAEEAIFGNCNFSYTDVFTNNTNCNLCLNVSTNSICTSIPKADCIASDHVCQKSVKWISTDKVMQVNSKCGQYQACSVSEANNPQSCVLTPDLANNVSCNFCCKGPTCMMNTIGGITKDLIFYLIYKGVYEIDVEIKADLKSVVNKKTKELLSNITAGIDANTIEIVSNYSSTVVSFTALLELKLTTFVTVSQESIKREISSSLEEKALLQTFTNYTLSSHIEGMECNTLSNLCAENLSCRYDQHNITRCLCDDPSFYKSLNVCLSVDELKAYGIYVVTSTQDTVTLAWKLNQHGTNVQYKLSIYPQRCNESVEAISDNGAKVVHLCSATQYSFTVTSVLSNSFYEKRVNSSTFEAWTRAAHGDKCYPYVSHDAETGDACIGDHIQCLLSSSAADNHCLCAPDYYFKINSGCSPLTELQVRNITVSRVSFSTVTLMWQADKNGANVSYTITISPEKGHPDSTKIEPGVMWIGLDPSTNYSFTVVSNLQDALYPLRSVEMSISDVWTSGLHGNSCDILKLNNGCEGEHIQCKLTSSAGPRCLCVGGFVHISNNTCLPLEEFKVKNLTAANITTDSVTLTWIGHKYGVSVIYSISIYPVKGQESRTTDSGALWFDLDQDSDYTFTVSSILKSDIFYPEMEVFSQITNVLTKKNITIFITYTRQDAVYQLFMANSSSQEYMKESHRIIEGVRSVIVKTTGEVSVQVVKFEPTDNKQYKVYLQIYVAAFDTEDIEKIINEAIQNNTKDSNGFFFKEKLKTLEMSTDQTTTYGCPLSVTSLDKGVISWDAAGIGTYYKPCPYNDPMENPAPFANRECLLAEDHSALYWGEVNDSLCVTKEVQDNPDFEKIFEKNVTIDNAHAMASLLKSYTEGAENFTSQMVSKTVKVLESLIDVKILKQPTIAPDIVGCVSNLLNVNDRTLKQSEKETSASKRILKVLDSVSNKTPFPDKNLKITASNIAVAMHKVSAVDTGDITLVTGSATFGRKDNSNISVEFSSNTSSQSGNNSSIIIPVIELLASLSPQDKGKVERIAFTVHRSDVLFSSIEDKGSPMKNATKMPVTKISDNNVEEKKPNLDNYVTKINSQVISASIPGVKVQNLNKNITMTFQHFPNNATNAVCVYWDEDVKDWSDKGCGVVELNEGSVTCGCNHLTNFALLMDVYGEGVKINPLDEKILSIISYIGCGISLFALLLTLLIYSVIKTLRHDNPSKILINLCLALFCSNFVYLVGMQNYAFVNPVSCKVVAVLMHYFLMASMCWMVVEAFYMYLALVLVFKTYFTSFILKCSLVGWGVPLVIIIITLAVNKTDNYGYINKSICWLNNPAFYIAFLGPVCLILFINLLAFLLVIKQLTCMSSNVLHKSDKNNTIQRLRGAIGVFILLGLTWIFAFFAIDQASVIFYYLFAIFNSLQGLFIFIFYCLLKKDVIQLIKRFLPCFEEFGEPSKSFSNSRGIAGKSLGHNMDENKSSKTSSKYDTNTNSTNVASLDSRKDSCFSTSSVINANETSLNDRLHECVDTDTDINNTNPNVLPEEASVRSTCTMETNCNSEDEFISSSPKIKTFPNLNPRNIYLNGSATIITNPSSDKLEKLHDDADDEIDESLISNSQNDSVNVAAIVLTFKNSISQETTAKFSEHKPDVESVDSSNLSSPTQSHSQSKICQNVHDDSSPCSEPIEQSSTAKFNQLSLENSNQAMRLLNPSFTLLEEETENPSVTAKGEIDYSHTATVADSKRKFEWSISEISDSSDLNSTKI